jgi:hypothetical protein
MSENELNWWLARSTARPFIADQLNLLISRSDKRKPIDWFYIDPLDDDEFVKASKKKLKELKEKRQNATSD